MGQDDDGQRKEKESLREEIRKLGVPPGALHGHWTTKDLQVFLWQAKREKRDAGFWRVALASAIASVVAALAAWAAVLVGRG